MICWHLDNWFELCIVEFIFHNHFVRSPEHSCWSWILPMNSFSHYCTICDFCVLVKFPTIEVIPCSYSFIWKKPQIIRYTYSGFLYIILFCKVWMIIRVSVQDTNSNDNRWNWSFCGAFLTFVKKRRTKEFHFILIFKLYIWIRYFKLKRHFKKH